MRAKWRKKRVRRLKRKRRKTRARSALYDGRTSHTSNLLNSGWDVKGNENGMEQKGNAFMMKGTQMFSLTPAERPPDGRLPLRALEGLAGK
ncbi:hypothetical protein CLAFUW4_06677 [Fulvia fulva]|uniref:60S ribosomal protein L41 n=1 Tax=Passalora fulva TaxID=5499 RepID=A0A9Q8PAL6_PASFU|nr:uncharacterized protein CLAFUR5_06820 [Fulvia fulva]KAK4621650.1 hypothetical protein CLAFUR4_06685 [Fulvia fulva]KAK4622881.1 hypothetical protein CLAFUR0_06679 [Fulvia fulva]UJO18917.1 hypothetical protein CLAFUR5_06820 [Fulvia fulva]WPV16045.1 hypothetical protein CLAFUW4_06677 [Fulvia fulva]WPV31661.1 hypothetical protein CLAFUW7_06676 [Fulvia fulva]